MREENLDLEQIEVLRFRKKVPNIVKKFPAMSTTAFLGQFFPRFFQKFVAPLIRRTDVFCALHRAIKNE
jgi:hypothetical protein